MTTTWKKTPAEVDAVIAQLDLESEQDAYLDWQEAVREQNELVEASTKLTRRMEEVAARANSAFDAYMSARRARRGMPC